MNKTQAYLKAIHDTPGCTAAFAMKESGVGNRNSASEYVALGYIEVVEKILTHVGRAKMLVCTYRITEAGRHNLLKAARVRKPQEGAKLHAPVKMRRGTSAPKRHEPPGIIYPEGYKHTVCATGLPQTYHTPADSEKLTGLATWS